MANKNQAGKNQKANRPTGAQNAQNRPAGKQGAGRSTGATAAGSASRREALRQQQEAEAARQKRNRLLVVIAAVLALALVIAAISYAVVHHNNNKNAAKSAAVTPANAVMSGSSPVGISDKPTNGKTAAADAPTLYEYQDYQCPVCKQYETAYGPTLEKLVDEGKINLQYRTLTFLDQNERNDASTRSAIAAACADTVGAYRKYHDVVYTNQPEQEGQGYTDQQLKSDFAQQAGITGDNLTKFQQCYDNRATSQFVTDVNNNGDNNLTSNGLKISTPQFFVDKNGKPSAVGLVLGQTQPTEDAILSVIKAAS